MQSQKKPHWILKGALELGWLFRAGPLFLCIRQSLDLGCPWKGREPWVTLFSSADGNCQRRTQLSTFKHWLKS